MSDENLNKIQLCENVLENDEKLNGISVVVGGEEEAITA